MKKKDPWATTPNTKRKRPMVMITLSRAALEELDKRRGQHSRGAFVEILLQVPTLVVEKRSKKSTGKA